MSVTINGTNGLVFADNSTQASSQVGMKNRIIDGGFIINQRGYVSGTSLSAGTYAHDRWKAGSGGCTYTFTQAAQGVNTTITITAGTLVQVIEGCNLPEGGTYVLSWTGTAQGRLNGGSYGASGITITGWTAGTNLNVEFNTGTLGSVQLEKGSTTTSFDYRPYGTELALCRRYLPFLTGTGNIYSGSGFTSTLALMSTPFNVTARIAPTGLVAYSPIGNFYVGSYAGVATTAMALNGASQDCACILVTTAGGLTGGTSQLLGMPTGSYIYFTGCEL